MKESFIGPTPIKTVWSLMPTVFLPAVEAAANYSSFADTQIVRPWDLDLPQELQYNNWTSETSKLLGRVMPIAPAQLDHLIFGYTAGAGRGAIEYAADPLLTAIGAATPKAERAAKPWQQAPAIGNFVRDHTFGPQSKSIQDLYDVAEAIVAVEQGIKVEQQAGQPARAVARLKEAREELPWQRKAAILNARQQLKEESAKIRKLYAAPSHVLSPLQKRERLDKHYERMVAISRRALGREPLNQERQAR